MGEGWREPANSGATLSARRRFYAPVDGTNSRPAHTCHGGNLTLCILISSSLLVTQTPMFSSRRISLAVGAVMSDLFPPNKKGLVSYLQNRRQTRRIFTDKGRKPWQMA
jgi:hypothetical protein